jgi:hypothetical protein
MPGERKARGRVSKSGAELEVGLKTGLAVGEDGNEESEMQKMRPGFSTLIVLNHFDCLVKVIERADPRHRPKTRDTFASDTEHGLVFQLLNLVFK